MAATVFLSESNGSVEVVTDNIANMNFGSLDSPNLNPSAYPINVGSFSVAKWWRVKLQALNGSTQIGNIKIWKSSGAYVTGESIGGCFFSGLNVYCNSYAHATVSIGGAAVSVPYSLNGAAIMGGAWSATPTPTSLPGSVQIYVGGVAGGNLIAPGYSNYLPMALSTTGSTPVGAVNQKVFTVQYDEA